MYTAALFLLATLLSLNSTTGASSELDKNDLNDTSHKIFVLNKNDTDLEKSNSCKCVPFYQCLEINNFSIARIGLFTKPINCSIPMYVCCRIIPIDETGGSEMQGMRNVSRKHIDSETNKGCGIARTFIKGRILTDSVAIENTIPGEVPWMVAILQKNKQPNRTIFKGAGTLIHPKVILTATHSVFSDQVEEIQLKVIATGKEVFQSSGSSDEERDVEKVIQHEEYYAGGLHNDIALLILSSEFDYSKRLLNSICLPQKNRKFSGGKCLAFGWGYNPDLKPLPLKKVDVPVLDHKRCETLLQKTRLGKDFVLHSSFICAGGEAGKDTCKGDGGGPLICINDDYAYVQAGIISWGVNSNGCGKLDEPGAYTDVSQFSEWVIRKLNENHIFIDKNDI